MKAHILSKFSVAFNQWLCIVSEKLQFRFRNLSESVHDAREIFEYPNGYHLCSRQFIHIYVEEIKTIGAPSTTSNVM